MKRGCSARAAPFGALAMLAPFGALAMLATLGGCMPSMPPAPALAEVTAPANWREQPAHTAATAASAAPALEAGWWRAFGDPTLDALVDAALARNTDLLAAAARVAQARAALQLADAADLPALNGSVALQSGRALASSGMLTSHTLQPTLQLSWEADLWGRLGALTEAARLQYRATQAERDGVALAVAATTAQAYIGLLALDAQLQLTRATAASRAEALRLAQDQVRVGYISQLQLTQADAEHQAVLQSIPQLEQALVRQENVLRLLAGQMPEPAPGSAAAGALEPPLRGSGGFDALQTPPVPETLPSELLARRPDIAQAALLLAASDASLAARRSAFLPQVALSASLGKLVTSPLDYEPQTIWSLGGSVLAPLFSAGRLTAQFDAAAAQRDQAAYAYRGKVLTAFGEVENALGGVQRIAAQAAFADRRRAILERSLVFARDRYQAGYGTYLEELDAQRNLYQTQIALISLRQEELGNLLALYRALGGGWRSP